MDFNAALCKGRSLLELLYVDDFSAGQMLSPSASSAESTFLDPFALRDWGYSPNYYNYSPTADLHHLQAALGVDPTHNRGIGHSHLDHCVHNGMYIPVTWAKFNSIVNEPGGMLVAVDNESPAALSRLNHKRITAADRLPELRYWSDVAYLQWAEVTKGAAAELRYVVRHGITNVRTISVMRHLLERDGRVETQYGRMVWPDVTWTDEEAVAALLGTPNGSGVARLLIHHKRQLGHKAVEEVKLVGFSEVPGFDGEPSLVFKIGDVHEEEGTEGGVDGDQDEGEDGSVRSEGEDEDQDGIVQSGEEDEDDNEDDDDDEYVGFWIFDLE